MRSMHGLLITVAVSLSMSCGNMVGGGGGGANGGTGGGGVGGAGGGAGGSGGGGTGGGGGGGGVAAQPDWVSGSRLRARVQTTGDGGKSFMGWYDSTLKTPCAFMNAADGQQRCLPTSAYTTVGTYYSDTNCMTALAQEFTTYASPCAPKYASKADSTGGTCADYGYLQPNTHIYSVGAVFSGTVYAFSGMPATCMPVTPTTGYPYTTYTFYQVGAELDPTMFETGTIVTE